MATSNRGLVACLLCLTQTVALADEVSIAITNLWSQGRAKISGHNECKLKFSRESDRSVHLRIWMEFRNLVDEGWYEANERTQEIDSSSLPLRMGWRRRSEDHDITAEISYDGTVLKIEDIDLKRGVPYTRTYNIWCGPDLKNVSKMEMKWFRGHELLERVTCDPNFF